MSRRQHERTTLLGPLYFYEMVRLARRGRSILLRFIYAVVIFGGLYLVYSTRFGSYDFWSDPFGPGPAIPINQRGQFGFAFAAAILLIQNLAALVLTPAYLAPAIAEEKERRTLEMLFTTHLSDREIIFGKLFSRLTHLFGILFASLPILAILQVWGGVDMRVVLGGFALTLITLLGAGSVSILASVNARTVVGAVVGSYALIAVGSLCLATVIPQLNNQQMDLAVVLGFGGAQMLITVICLSLAVAGLRNDLAREVNTPTPPVALVQARPGWDIQPPLRPQPARSQGPIIERPRLPYHPTLPPSFEPKRFPVTDNALLWKEMYHGANEAAGWSFTVVYFITLIGGLVIVLLIALAGMEAFELREVTEPLRDGSLAPFFAVRRYLALVLTPTVQTLTMLLMGAWCLALSVRAATSITRERQLETLGSLLTLPLERTEILRAKWLGCILRFRQIGFVLAAFWTIGLLCGVLHPLSAILLALAGAIHLTLFASMSLWVSLTSRNNLWSNCTMALMLMLAFAGGHIYTELALGRYSARTWWRHLLEIGLSPLNTLRRLAFSWPTTWETITELRDWRLEINAGLCGLLMLALLAAAFWVISCRIFEKQCDKV